MSRTIRWGIAGTGTIATLFAEGLAHARAHDHPAELVAVASRNAERAQPFAARFGARSAHGSYEALASDPEVDIVYVATPNSDHHPRAIQMLEGGKAVLVEKPFALDAAETREVLAVAARKKLFCMEAMWMRFMPAVEELVERVRTGALGDATAATIELGHPAEFRADHRLFDPALGGGALLDLGVYTVSLAVLLFGAPTHVQSQALIGASGVDEHVTALLSHANGRQSTIGASLRTRLSNGASVSGTKAWARLHEPLYRPSAITIVNTPAAVTGTAGAAPTGFKARARQSAWLRDTYQRLRSALPPALLGGGHTIHAPYAGNGYPHEAIEAMRCLTAGELESPRLPLRDTLIVMETIDSIRKNWRVV